MGIVDVEVGAGILFDVIGDVVVVDVVDVDNVLAIVAVVTVDVVVSTVDVVAVVDFLVDAGFVVVVVFIGNSDVCFQISSFFESMFCMFNSIWLEFKFDGKVLNFLAYARLNFSFHFTVFANIDFMSHL